MTKGYEQRKEANARYLAKFESILIRVTPEEKAVYQKAADASGMSLTTFMRAAASVYIKQMNVIESPIDTMPDNK